MRGPSCKNVMLESEPDSCSGWPQYLLQPASLPPHLQKPTGTPLRMLPEHYWANRFPDARAFSPGEVKFTSKESIDGYTSCFPLSSLPPCLGLREPGNKPAVKSLPPLSPEVLPTPVFCAFFCLSVHSINNSLNKLLSPNILFLYPLEPHLRDVSSSRGEKMNTQWNRCAGLRDAPGLGSPVLRSCEHSCHLVGFAESISPAIEEGGWVAC